eukprot:4491037-Prymnesium_polylepis.1
MATKRGSDEGDTAAIKDQERPRRTRRIGAAMRAAVFCGALAAWLDEAIGECELTTVDPHAA